MTKVACEPDPCSGPGLRIIYLKAKVAAEGSVGGIEETPRNVP
jgi:hypothetical protein